MDPFGDVSFLEPETSTHSQSSSSYQHTQSQPSNSSDESPTHSPSHLPTNSNAPVLSPSFVASRQSQIIRHKPNFTAILVYVDALVLSGNNLGKIQAMKLLLDIEFNIKDLGQLKLFLGMEIAMTSQGILLYQRKYALDLLEECKFLDSKPCSTPMEYNGKLIHSKSGSPWPEPCSYRRLMGKMLYLAHTRSELSFGVGHLSQFLSALTHDHFVVAMRILRYLKGFIITGIFFPTESDLRIKGYSDSDWASCPNTRKFVSVYCFFLYNSLVFWKSKKQQTVSRSSAEAEYRASCEAQWLVGLLEELRFPDSEPVQLYCDNRSSMHIAANLVFQECTKHI
ncbi:PREDICTED: uncharacterized protein LOC109337375 [Lupinus angustifolius]|uniref:uncharacterized protein LOC109337375 n=1 Tax=Lupinus angustifolius TaxID=3871 RepID=UPI00092F449F|nr:PREDICTED: uncharacterized protein LOC109337375 [Lupinus angustifolius]